MSRLSSTIVRRSEHIAKKGVATGKNVGAFEGLQELTVVNMLPVSEGRPLAMVSRTANRQLCFDNRFQILRY